MNHIGWIRGEDLDIRFACFGMICEESDAGALGDDIMSDGSSTSFAPMPVLGVSIGWADALGTEGGVL